MSITWDPTINAGHVLTALGFLFTGGALIVSARSLRRTAMVQRGEFLLELTERYFKDDAVRAFYYQVDWGSWTFSDAAFPHSEAERLLDRLLYSFDEIGQVLRIGAITRDEAGVFAFQASRVLRNDEVAAYLAMLDKDYRAEGLDRAHAGARYLVESVAPTMGVSRRAA